MNNRTIAERVQDLRAHLTFTNLGVIISIVLSAYAAHAAWDANSPKLLFEQQPAFQSVECDEVGKPKVFRQLIGARFTNLGGRTTTLLNISGKVIPGALNSNSRLEQIYEFDNAKAIGKNYFEIMTVEATESQFSHIVFERRDGFRQTVNRVRNIVLEPGRSVEFSFGYLAVTDDGKAPRPTEFDLEAVISGQDIQTFTLKTGVNYVGSDNCSG